MSWDMTLHKEAEIYGARNSHQRWRKGKGFDTNK
jgi:hypothetical protein